MGVIPSSAQTSLLADLRSHRGPLESRQSAMRVPSAVPAVWSKGTEGDGRSLGVGCCCRCFRFRPHPVVVGEANTPSWVFPPFLSWGSARGAQALFLQDSEDQMGAWDPASPTGPLLKASTLLLDAPAQFQCRVLGNCSSWRSGLHVMPGIQPGSAAYTPRRTEGVEWGAGRWGAGKVLAVSPASLGP